jgi:diguanylate cyclase (GGDEF)-like protein/PAS domain S-box-containing protein
MANTDHLVRVLLVEDNLDEAELLQEMLGAIRKPGFQVIHKSCLTEGIDYLKENWSGDTRIDIVLLDLHLPDGAGFELYERLLNQAPWVPVILLTNLNDEELALKTVRNGAQDYLLKTEVDCRLLGRAIRYAIERKQIKEALKESEERYMLAIQGSNDGLWDWNLQTNEVYYSPRWAEILLSPIEEISNSIDEWKKRIHPDDREITRATLENHLAGLTDHFESEHRLKREDGSYVWVLIRGMAIRDQAGKSYRMAGSLTDISVKKQIEEKLYFDAFHDDLTKLPNRALFLDRLMHAIERSKRFPQSRFAVLFFDLDRFKLINDCLGHTYGDQLLAKVADTLQTSLRACDSAARLSGDEFAILLEDIQVISDAVQIAERIQQALQSPIQVNGHKIVVSASIGIVISDPRYTIPEDILRDADIAMYHAKLHGKACHAVFQSSMYKRSILRLELENELREVLATDETRQQHLFVAFQPIVSAQDKQILGFEALVRWIHPERGMIYPNEFIPLAEETGLIHTLGLWVLREACQQVKIWQTRLPNLPNYKPLSVSVNISGKQFTQPNLVEQIKHIIQECNISPASLNLEITERLLVENNTMILASLQELRNMGINLQIDDFGRGYSSFGYLQHFPVNTLKIDSLFIQRIDQNHNNTEIIRSIVGLAKSLGLSVIAEGVETDNQFERLKQLECHYIQGYYISEAVRGDEAEKLLLKNRNLLNSEDLT